jgi:hypothetical protein
MTTRKIKTKTTTKRIENRGGARKGAGRKAATGAEGLRKRSLMLNDDTMRKAKAIGRGSASEGVRRAIDGFDLNDEHDANETDD